jgi:thiamine pyrophosphate-dependent acetolactate synthase large subunit-like protein
MAKGARLAGRVLEKEGVERIFGIPGEENLDRRAAYAARRSSCS